jgi:NADPH:quinone reductase-like Zn-dependent oxidoreductase
MFGLRHPKKTILGTELAGEVEAVGKDVTLFKKGDQVFGIGSDVFGAYAEYACRPETGALAIKPANLTYAGAPFLSGTAHIPEDVAKRSAVKKSSSMVLPAGLVSAAWQPDTMGRKSPGCAARRMWTVKSLGADKVIDYTTEDFTRNGETYDIIMDTVVGKTSFARCKNSLAPKGLYLAVAGGLKEMIDAVDSSGGKCVSRRLPNSGVELHQGIG